MATTLSAPITHPQAVQGQQPAMANLEHLIYILSDSDSDSDLTFLPQSGSEYESEFQSEFESEFESEFHFQFPYYSFYL